MFHKKVYRHRVVLWSPIAFFFATSSRAKSPSKVKKSILHLIIVIKNFNFLTQLHLINTQCTKLFAAALFKLILKSFEFHLDNNTWRGVHAFYLQSPRILPNPRQKGNIQVIICKITFTSCCGWNHRQFFIKILTLALLLNFRVVISVFITQKLKKCF